MQGAWRGAAKSHLPMNDENSCNWGDVELEPERGSKLRLRRWDRWPVEFSLGGRWWGIIVPYDWDINEPLKQPSDQSVFKKSHSVTSSSVINRQRDGTAMNSYLVLYKPASMMPRNWSQLRGSWGLCHQRPSESTLELRESSFLGCPHVL